MAGDCLSPLSMLSPSLLAGHSSVPQHLMTVAAARVFGANLLYKISHPTEAPHPDFPAGHSEALQQLQQLLAAAAALVPSVQCNLQVLPEDVSRPAISTGTRSKVKHRLHQVQAAHKTTCMCCWS